MINSQHEQPKFIISCYNPRASENGILNYYIFSFWFLIRWYYIIREVLFGVVSNCGDIESAIFL